MARSSWNIGGDVNSSIRGCEFLRDCVCHDDTDVYVYIYKRCLQKK